MIVQRFRVLFFLPTRVGAQPRARRKVAARGAGRALLAVENTRVLCLLTNHSGRNLRPAAPWDGESRPLLWDSLPGLPVESGRRSFLPGQVVPRCVCVCVKVARSWPTLCNPVDCIVHGSPQARVLEWVAFPSSGGIFPTQGSNPGLPLCRRILYQLSPHGSSQADSPKPAPEVVCACPCGTS